MYNYCDERDKVGSSETKLRDKQRRPSPIRLSIFIKIDQFAHKPGNLVKKYMFHEE